MNSDLISIFHKGMPIASQGKSIKEFLATDKQLFTADFQFPIMVLRDSAIEHNIQRMASYCKSLGFELAPHVKTPMAPKIAKRQIDAGAWGLTIANFNQAAIMLASGFTRLIIGNEVMEPTSIAKDNRFFVLGVSGFEGAVPGGDRNGEGIEKIRIFLRQIIAAATIAKPFIRGEKIIISAGGSSYFDYVVEEFAKYDGDALLLLRSGGYLSHDHIHYEYLYPFMGLSESDRFYPALELWARVLSVPEANLAILNFGKRDAGNDLDEPLPVLKFAGKPVPFEAKIKMLNDQHAFMEISPGSVVVGDLIGCGISHPCTNFDKWRLLPLVNDDYEIIDLINTHF